MWITIAYNTSKASCNLQAEIQLTREHLKSELNLESSGEIRVCTLVDLIAHGMTSFFVGGRTPIVAIGDAIVTIAWHLDGQCGNQQKQLQCVRGTRLELTCCQSALSRRSSMQWMACLQWWPFIVHNCIKQNMSSIIEPCMHARLVSSPTKWIVGGFNYFRVDEHPAGGLYVWCMMLLWTDHTKWEFQIKLDVSNAIQLSSSYISLQIPIHAQSMKNLTHIVRTCSGLHAHT